MNPVPVQLGLPSAEVLEKYRIWDSYFTPAHSNPGDDGCSEFQQELERSLPAIQLGRIERLCYFAHVGIGTTGNAVFEALVKSRPEVVRWPMEMWPQLLLGMIQLNPQNAPASLEAIDRWIKDGPMLGVYFPGGGPAALTCTHRNCRRLIERAIDLDGVIMQHTWFKTGGKESPGESTPTELAEVAARYPEQNFLCAHAGGEWERGIRAVQAAPNILVETSGFDPTAGFIETAVRVLGAERIVFGSHLPSRSLGTELGKVLGAQITDDARRLILGENYRQLLRPVLESNRR